MNPYKIEHPRPTRALKKEAVEKLTWSLRYLAEVVGALGAVALFYAVSIGLVIILGLPVDGGFMLAAWAVLFVGGMWISTAILKGIPGWRWVVVLLGLVQAGASFIGAFIMMLASADWQF